MHKPKKINGKLYVLATQNKYSTDVVLSGQGAITSSIAWEVKHRPEWNTQIKLYELKEVACMSNKEYESNLKDNFKNLIAKAGA
jgi:hypothetical protein